MIYLYLYLYMYIYTYTVFIIYIINKMSTLGTTKKFQHV